MRTLGIDLGTTHTVGAKHAAVVPLAGDTSRPMGLLPSVVALPPSGPPLVGERARWRRGNDPANTISSSKRIIGRPGTAPEVTTWAERSAVRLGRDARGGVVFETRAGALSPADVASMICVELIRAGGLDAPRLSAVVTVPVAFDPAQVAATLSAVRAAGFREARAVMEPVATAIAYLARQSTRYAAVYDLGGGTFDLAIIDCTCAPFRVLAHGGDAWLGGDDVDHALARYASDVVLRESGWDLSADREVWERLRIEAERAKIRLGREELTSIDVAHVDPAAPTQVATIPIDRRLLRSIASDLIRRTFAICDRVLGEAGIRARDIDAVFLAGGSTSLPGLRDDVGAYFGKRARSDLEPMHVVAIGASLAAARPDLAGLLVPG